MNASLDGVDSNRGERFLSMTYDRIRRMVILLGLAGAIAAGLLFGWRSGLALTIGTAVAYINLVWLHRGSAMMIDRMLSPAGRAPSKLRLAAVFSARYISVLAIAYGIIKGFPSMILGFTIGLFLPILAAICEGVYEALVNGKASD